MIKLKELTGYHSPVTGSGRSLPPLGAIHTICDPPLHLNMFDYMSAFESIWKHIDLITSKSLTFSYRKGNAWRVTKNHNTRTVSSVLSLKKKKKKKNSFQCKVHYAINHENFYNPTLSVSGHFLSLPQICK